VEISCAVRSCRIGERFIQIQKKGKV